MRTVERNCESTFHKKFIFKRILILFLEIKCISIIEHMLQNVFTNTQVQILVMNEIIINDQKASQGDERIYLNAIL